jgi:hypothetical protein
MIPPDAARQEKPSAERREGLTRREFTIRLGAGAGASIVGFFLLGKSLAPVRASNAAGSVSETPELSDRIVFGTYDGMVAIRAEGDSHSPLCAVNETGAAVLELLNGANDVAAVSRAIAAKLRIARSEALDAKIAYFVVQLSQLGFLKEPFFACIFETRIS